MGGENQILEGKTRLWRGNPDFGWENQILDGMVIKRSRLQDDGTEELQPFCLRCLSKPQFSLTTSTDGAQIVVDVEAVENAVETAVETAVEIAVETAVETAFENAENSKTKRNTEKLLLTRRYHDRIDTLPKP